LAEFLKLKKLSIWLKSVFLTHLIYIYSNNPISKIDTLGNSLVFLTDLEELELMLSYNFQFKLIF